jgi:hypothetical protein
MYIALIIFLRWSLSVLQGSIRGWGVDVNLYSNEEPGMRNLIIDGAAGGETKRRHDVTFPLLTPRRGLVLQVPHYTCIYYWVANS